MGIKLSKQDLISDLIKVTNELGHPPLVNEYERIGKYSPPPFRQQFGSWENSLKAAGLKPTPLHRHFWTDTDLDNEIARLEQELGHKPSWREIRSRSKISEDTFMRRKGRTGFNDPWDIALPEWDVNNISIEDGNWISGFVVGEGTFGVRINAVVFGITQRSDSLDLIEFIRETMGLPNNIVMSSNTRRRSLGQKVGDECRLYVSNRWELKLRIIPFFDRFLLKGRKQAEYQIFKQAVEFLCNRDKVDGRKQKHFNPEERRFLTELTEAIKAIRYDPTAHQ